MSQIARVPMGARPRSGSQNVEIPEGARWHNPWCTLRSSETIQHDYVNTSHSLGWRFAAPSTVAEEVSRQRVWVLGPDHRRR